MTEKEGDVKPKLLVLVAAVALLVPAAPMAFGAEPALDGTYTATGFNSDGSEYHAVVRIVRRGESFLVAWLVPKIVDEAMVLVPTSGGVAVKSGGTLAVSYYGQDLTGVILYQIEDGGERLVGRWVAAEGDGAVRSETLTRVRPASTPPAAPETRRPVPKHPKSSALPDTVIARR